MKSARRFAVACTLLIVLAAPARAQQPQQDQQKELPADTTAMDWSRVPEYRVVPGDVLRFNFGPVPDGSSDLYREAKVRPDGRVSVCPVGDVVAAGRTPRELEGVLTDLLAMELRQPRVTVEVGEMAGNQVHVLGRVKTPGSYEVTPFMTVAQAVAVAGGFEDDASSNDVLVFHRDGAHTVRVARVPLDRALKRGTLEADLLLSRFDIVFVPRSAIGNIDVFARQFFGEPAQILNFMFIGWELFHLNQIFVVNNTRP